MKMLFMNYEIAWIVVNWFDAEGQTHFVVSVLRSISSRWTVRGEMIMATSDVGLSRISPLLFLNYAKLRGVKWSSNSWWVQHRETTRRLNVICHVCYLGHCILRTVEWHAVPCIICGMSDVKTAWVGYLCECLLMLRDGFMIWLHFLSLSVHFIIPFSMNASFTSSNPLFFLSSSTHIQYI